MNQQQIEISKCYHHDWLSRSAANSLERTLGGLDFREYAYRASVLKRAPKCEFFLPFADGTVPLYRWGQTRTEYTTGRPFSDVPLLEKLRQRLSKETDETPNHCIIIRYSDGLRHHAPPHRDRQKGVPGNGAHDMALDTSFLVVTVGYPRNFQLLDECQSIVWQERLAHGSLLQVTADLNRSLWHAVPRDPEQPEDRPRYSAIFRTIGHPEATARR